MPRVLVRLVQMVEQWQRDALVDAATGRSLSAVVAGCVPPRPLDSQTLQEDENTKDPLVSHAACPSLPLPPSLAS